MGFLSGLGRTVTNAAKEGIRGGLIDGFLNGMGNSSATGNVGYINYTYDADTGERLEGTEAINETYRLGLFYNEDDFERRNNNFNSYGVDYQNEHAGAQNANETNNSYGYYRDKYSYLDSNDKLNNSLIEDINKNKVSIMQNVPLLENVGGPSDTYAEAINQLRLPNWGYADFINERAVWQKQIGNAFNDPAWFYFKIFFDFDTLHGLFGTLLNRYRPTSGENCAARYLMLSRSMYKDEDVDSRITALYKFASILNYITVEAPWFFKGVRGLDKLSMPSIRDFSNEKYIEIDLMADAIDMRLTTLMSLYKYICYDDYTHKEILPENLRQFTMSIVLFQTPLRYLHTSYSSQKSINFMGLSSTQFGINNLTMDGPSEKKRYKTLNPQNFGDTMSFKIYTLYGCEFDMESFATVIKGDVSNEEPFKLGENTIKIKFASCVEHSMNEFYEMLYGSNGFYFNHYSQYQNDHTINRNSYADDFHKKQLERYQALIDTFATPGTGGSILGVIDSPKTYQHAVDASEALLNGMFNDNDLLGDLGSNFILGLLGSSKSAYTPQGNIYGDVGIGSAYFKDKLEMLKNGVHENTMPPHYYDPERGVVYERGKPSNEYSAYSMYNLNTSINNFDLGNWLNTGTTSLGQTVNDRMRSLASGSNRNYIEHTSRIENVKDPYQYDSKNAVNNSDLNNFKYGKKDNTEGQKDTDTRLNTVEFKHETNDFKNADKPNTEKPKDGDTRLHTEEFIKETNDFKYGDKPHTEKPKTRDTNIESKQFIHDIHDLKHGDKPHTEKPKDGDTRLHTEEFKRDTYNFKYADKPNTEHHKNIDTRLHTEEFVKEITDFKYADKPNTEKPKTRDTNLESKQFIHDVHELKHGDKPNTEKPKDIDTRLHTKKFVKEITDFKYADKPNTEHHKNIDTRLHTEEFKHEINDFKNADKPNTEKPKNRDTNLESKQFIHDVHELKHGDKPHTEKPKDGDTRLQTEEFKHEINDFKYADKPNTEHHKDADTRLKTEEFRRETNNFKYADKPNTEHHKDIDTRLHTKEFKREINDFKYADKPNTEKPKDDDTRLHTEEFKREINDFKYADKPNTEHHKDIDTRLHTEEFKREINDFKDSRKDNVTYPYNFDNSDKNYEIKNIYDYLTYNIDTDDFRNTGNGNIRKPYLYDIVNPKAEESWRQPHPLATNASDPDKSPKLDSLSLNEKKYRERNYLNDGEGTEQNNLETPETRKPYKYEEENPYALESWRSSNEYDVKNFMPNTEFLNLDAIRIKENKYMNMNDERNRINNFDEGMTRKPYKYAEENPKAEEDWRQAHPDSSDYGEYEYKNDSLEKYEYKYRNRNYLNDGEGTELNDLYNTETMPPFKYDAKNAVKYESDKANKNGSS